MAPFKCEMVIEYCIFLFACKSIQMLCAANCRYFVYYCVDKLYSTYYLVSNKCSGLKRYIVCL